MTPTRVLIVDDHAILRMGLASLLSSKKDIEVVGDAANGPEGIRRAIELKPDVVVMDLMMPGMGGAEATARLLEKAPDAKVLIITTFDTSDGIDRALKAGARGAIMKNCDFEELVDALRTVASGGSYIAPDVKRLFSNDPPAITLSPRQREMLQSIARGLSNPDIAKQFGISIYVVKEHIAALFAKIGAANRSEAVAIAMRKNLLAP
ncbi:MAG: response regulator transcription factor [Kiritimatiellae bacterium]|jgi:DNA-binding NarL/FixJ family response regulator|nr:response regulator transcription factor [Kiritimatiellia bacterium]